MTSHPGPTVSIIIPTFNRAGLIVATLESVCAQTFGGWECLVIDDGSTDETAAVVGRFVARDARFRYTVQPHAGASAARNAGVRDASGRYVTFLDSDDLFPAPRLGWQVQAMDDDPGAVLAYGDAACFDDHDLSKTYSYMAQAKQLPSGSAAFEAMIQCGCVAAPLARRDAVLRVGGFDESLETAEDWDLWLSLSKIGRVIYRPLPSLLIRRHAGNKSANTLRNYRGVDRVARKQLRDRPPWRRIRLYRAARRFFRTGGWLDALLAAANRLNDREDWARARLVWRAAAHLEPRLLWRVRVLMNVGWALVPTNHPPPWRPMWRWMQRDGAASPRRHRALRE